MNIASCVCCIGILISEGFVGSLDNNLLGSVDNINTFPVPFTYLSRAKMTQSHRYPHWNHLATTALIIGLRVPCKTLHYLPFTLIYDRGVSDVCLFLYIMKITVITLLILLSFPFVCVCVCVCAFT